MKIILTLLLSLFFLGISARITNDAGIKLIKSFEGFFPNFYIDPVGIRTIGYGHACHVWDCNNLIAKSSSGSTRKVTAPLSEQEAHDLLRNDLGAGGFESCVENAVSVSINDNQFAALVSFTFNVGCGGFRSSSALRYINQNQFDKVRAALALWNKGGGRVLPGLVRRRAAEADLFESGGGSSGGGGGQTCFQPSTGEKGICGDASSCTGETVSGLCPGDSSVRCCMKQPCGSGANSGVCRDEGVCSGSTLSGLCPGESFYKCCVGGSGNTGGNAPSSPCPTGASFDSSVGYCVDAVDAYGPFTYEMTQKCIEFGGGEVTCKSEQPFTINGVNVRIQRWGRTFAKNIRGDGACPLGSSSNSNFLGHCVETLPDGKQNVFGPFSENLVELCRNAQGGSACLTGRWSAGFFRYIATGASYTVTVDNGTETSTTGLDDIIQDQQGLGETDAASALLAFSPLLLVSLAFFFSFAHYFM